jgi:hypothetical protein
MLTYRYEIKDRVTGKIVGDLYERTAAQAIAQAIVMEMIPGQSRTAGPQAGSPRKPGPRYVASRKEQVNGDEK